MLWLIAILMTLGMANAWTAGFEPPSGTEVFTVQGINFTTEDTDAPIGYAGSTRALYGTYILGDAGAATTLINDNVTGRMTISRSSGSGTPTVAVWLPTPDSSRTYGFTVGAVSRFDGTTYTSICTSITSGNLTYHNSTHWNATTSSGCSGLLNAYTEAIAFETTTLGTYEIWNVSGSMNRETNFSKAYPPTYTSSGLYLSINGPARRTLRSDMRANFTKIEYAEMNQMCQANLQYNGQNTINPKITVFMPAEAYPQLRNGSKAYLKNGTDAYVLDEGTGYWFYVPSTECASFSSAGTVAVTYHSQGGGNPSFNSYIYNGENIGMYSSNLFCYNSTVTARRQVQMYIFSNESRRYNVTIYTGNNTIYNISTVEGDDILITTAELPQNATNITIRRTDRNTTGVMFEIRNHCSPVTLPSQDNRAAFVALWLMILIAAAVAESTLGAGIETFTALSIVAAAISTGFLIVGAILALYYGIRLMKPLME